MGTSGNLCSIKGHLKIIFAREILCIYKVRVKLCPEAIVIKPVRVCMVHANWENGKREEEESMSGSVQLGLS